jgi:5-dehydro-2-deoxygluconokinase
MTEEILIALPQKSVLVLGRAGLDLYPDKTGQKIRESNQFIAMLGGSAGNIAAGIARRGHSVSLLTSVSNDPVGEFTISQIKKFGIDGSLIQTVDGESRTSLALSETNNHDHQTVIYRNQAADFNLMPPSVDAGQFSCLVVTGTALAKDPSRTTTLGLMNQFKRHGTLVILDLDYRPYSWASTTEVRAVYNEAIDVSDVVVGNDVEFRSLDDTEDDLTKIACSVSDAGTLLTILKLGSSGSITLTKLLRINCGIYQVDPLKPVGSGDAFLSSLISSWIEKKNLIDSLCDASASAAIVVSKVGCSEAMPEGQEIEVFRNQAMQPQIETIRRS